jgi:hypothetical protein
VKSSSWTRGCLCCTSSPAALGAARCRHILQIKTVSPVRTKPMSVLFFFLKKKKELLSRLVVSHTRVHAMGSRAWRTPTSNAASSRDGKPFLAIRYVSTRHRVRIHYRERDMGRT